MPNGKKCHSMALRNLPYCYFHNRLHRLALEKIATDKGENAKTEKKKKNKNIPEKNLLELPVPEDQSAIQMSVGMVLKALGSDRLEPKYAGLFLYGLQIATLNVPRGGPILPSDTVPAVTLNGDGQEMGPENLACDVPDDCECCDDRKHCLVRRTVAGLHGGTDPLDEMAAADNHGNDAEDDAGDES